MRSSPRSKALQVPTVLILAAFLNGCEDTSGRLEPLPNFAPRVGEIRDDGDGLIIGHRLMAAGEYELALNAYARTIPTRGIDADLLSALGSANLRLGRINQAERLLRQATKRDDTFVPAWNNLGVTLLSQGKAREAQEVFRLAFALTSGASDEIRDNLRLAEQNLEKFEFDKVDTNDFRLVRRGNGRYLLLGQ